MSTLLFLEKKQRMFISIFFRLLIISFSIFILFKSDYRFNWYVNIGAYTLYIIIYLICFAKQKYSYLRLLNDYTFIFFIIYQYKIIDLLSFSLIFSPILNSQNHSGEKRSKLLYLLPLLIYTIVVGSFHLFTIIPFLLFFLINSFEEFRNKYVEFNHNLNQVIDDFFLGNNNKLHKIYQKIIPIFKSSPFKLNVQDIFCFKFSEDKIRTINGSKFILYYNLDTLNVMLYCKSVKRRLNIQTNVSLSINGKKLNNNITFMYDIDGKLTNFYIFFITLGSPLSLQSYYLTDFKLLLSPFFIRLAKLFEFEQNRKSIEIEQIKEIGTKNNYVNRAINSMHFIRNKLGPIVNYLSMDEEYSSSSEALKERIRPHLDKERRKIKSSLDSILEYSNFLLEVENNPLKFNNLELIEVQKLFSTIRTIWNEYKLEETNIDVIGNNIFQHSVYVYYNKVGMQLVLINWISNIYKYNSGYYKLEISKIGEFLILKFINSFDETKCKVDFIKLFSYDRLEIEKHKNNSHGLSELKDFLFQMNIRSDMKKEEKNVILEIKLNTQNNESIDI